MSYPVLLHLDGRQAVVVGGGQVAVRKVTDLLAAGAHVAVISPAITALLQRLVDEGRVNWHKADYATALLHELRPFLVIAATDSAVVNAQVIADAHDLGVLVSAIDNIPGSDYSSMAAVRRGKITVAAATDGASPALAAHLRRRLELLIGDEYEIVADWLAELRPVVQKHIPSPEARRILWESILDSPILDHLRQGDEWAARREIDCLLAEAGVGETVS